MKTPDNMPQKMVKYMVAKNTFQQAYVKGQRPRLCLGFASPVTGTPISTRATGFCARGQASSISAERLFESSEDMLWRVLPDPLNPLLSPGAPP